MAKKNIKQSNSISAKIVRGTISQTRKDIADWKNAIRLARLNKSPKFYQLQDIYSEIADDALLYSQLNNRLEQSVSKQFEVVGKDGKENEELTKQLLENGAHNIIKSIVEAKFYGYSLQEFQVSNGSLTIYNVPRRHIDPVFGRIYPDATQSAFIEYRDMLEYGKSIVEYNSHDFGLLNKAVPHVLFKKFAQSCWSELCEIYGIPPRYIKTNTNDPIMLDRAEKMMREVGTAAAFVIDTTEEFSFAQGASTNGDVYSSLIKLCNDEISLLISGAVIGQDTENGNYSKEESSIKMLDRLIDADKEYVTTTMNTVVIPALQQLGFIPQGEFSFKYKEIEDTEKLWTMVQQVLPYKEVDNKWMEDKFGIPVADKSPLGLSANNSDSFFA